MSLQVNSLSARVRALWLLGQCASSVVWQGGSADSLYPRWPTSPPCSHFAQTQSDPWPPRTLRLAPGSSVTRECVSCLFLLPRSRLNISPRKSCRHSVFAAGVPPTPHPTIPSRVPSSLRGFEAKLIPEAVVGPQADERKWPHVVLPARNPACSSAFRPGIADPEINRVCLLRSLPAQPEVGMGAILSMHPGDHPAQGAP